MRELSEESISRITKKLVIVGEGATGKTALLMVQAGEEYPESYVPTIFENYISEIYIPGSKKPVELSLWDTAGQEEYDRLRPLSYPDTDVIILAYSICNPDSFRLIKEKWLPETRHFLPDTPSILVALKLDLRDDPNIIEDLSKLKLKPISREQGMNLARDIGANKYFECSAKNKDGIGEIFTAAAKLACKHSKRRNASCKII